MAADAINASGGLLGKKAERFGLLEEAEAFPIGVLYCAARDSSAAQRCRPSAGLRFGRNP